MVGYWYTGPVEAVPAGAVPGAPNLLRAGSDGAQNHHRLNVQ
ncbi:cbl-d [Culex quinquefasciatus]|uniref:Cbl-d n=1 Tax=Culex quinquefasciatus TaxID=7176 RepID=B0WYC0_CULQU|nr:cbl-d [Culex quinquefasciatus]|eukprot:XP_001862392.1 cbl-d [Culex quinquefasciatus]